MPFHVCSTLSSRLTSRFVVVFAIVLAMSNNPFQCEVDKVEVYLNGMPTGIELPGGGNGYFQMVQPFQTPFFPHEYLLEMIGSDTDVSPPMETYIWPYFTVE